MGMIGGLEQENSRLVREICELSARAISCSNLHLPRTNKSPFIDWYLVLRVNENADIYSIRKQYRKLALQLHPDKNKHSKAETAFKLVSEAYYFLSDTARRTSFDSLRKNITCFECNSTTTSTKPTKPQETSKHTRIHRQINELRIKLRDEATIIEKCLTANSSTSSRSTETPVFDPTDYQNKGYPHRRTMRSYKNLDALRAGFKMGDRWTRGDCESPIFEFRSGRSPLMSRCSSTRDRRDLFT